MAHRARFLSVAWAFAALILPAGCLSVDAEEDCALSGECSARPFSNGHSTAPGSDHALLQIKSARAQHAAQTGDYQAQQASELEEVSDWPSFAPSWPPSESTSSSPSRRRRFGRMQHCRRRRAPSSSGTLPEEDVGKNWQCQGNEMVMQPPSLGSSGSCANPTCLCVFDIDRTLTGRQDAIDDEHNCSRNYVTQMYDDGYGGGNATLSALAVAGINTTFCNQCLLGITSAGHGSGPGSPWNEFLLNSVMRGDAHDQFIAAHPNAKTWSYGLAVMSPFVLNQANKKKQQAVELIRQWLQSQEADLCIPPSDVHFFGDRTENILPFQEMGFNSREISCGSRDFSRHDDGMIGYCGAVPEEIISAEGNFVCANSSSEGEPANSTAQVNASSDEGMVTSF